MLDSGCCFGRCYWRSNGGEIWFGLAEMGVVGDNVYGAGLR